MGWAAIHKRCPNLSMATGQAGSRVSCQCATALPMSMIILALARTTLITDGSS